VQFRDLAANADEHMILFSEMDPDDDSDVLQFSSATTSDGTWSSPVATPLGVSDLPQLLVPSTHGFLLTWYDAVGYQAAIFDGTAWGSPAMLTASAGTLRGASNGTGFALAWTDFNAIDSKEHVFLAVHDGTTWSDVVDFDADGDLDEVQLSATDSGYAVAYHTSTNINVATWQGGTWSAPVFLSTDGDTASTFKLIGLQTDGTGFAAAFYQDELRVSPWNGTAWSAPHTWASGDFPMLAGTRGRYALAARTDASGHYEMQLRPYTTAGFGAAQVLEAASEDDTVLMQSNDFSLALVWLNPAPSVTPFRTQLYGAGEL
jgi:hypothetical protein